MHLFKGIIIILGVFFASIIFLNFIFFVNGFLENISWPANKNGVVSKSSNELGEAVKKELEKTKGEYAVVVKNLNTGERYVINEKRIFDSASLYKLWVMVESFNQIEKGTLDEDKILSEDVRVLNEKFGIEAEEAEIESGTVSYSVNDAIDQMIAISHNYAALLLSSEVGLSNVQRFLKDNGFVDSTIGSPPKTTAYDIALFFEKIYKGELVSRNNSKKMLELLKTQRLNHKIPKYLPEGVIIAHKTGELGRFTHDAGIVFGKIDYIIVILSESDNPKHAEDTISNISKSVFEYLKP